MLTCRELWHGLSEAQVRALVNRRERPPVPDFFAQRVRALLQECWSELPAERPSPAEILYRLAGGTSLPYLFLPKSSSRSVLRDSSSSKGTNPDTLERPKSSKTVKWALPHDLQSQPTREFQEVPSHAPPPQNLLAPKLHIPIDSLPSPYGHHPLNLPQPYVDSSQLLSTPRNLVFPPSDAAPPLSAAQNELSARLQPMLHLHMPPLPYFDGQSPRSQGQAAPAPHVARGAVSATRFALNLSDAAVKVDTRSQQQHDLAVNGASEHIHSTAAPTRPKPVASATQFALNLSNTVAAPPLPQLLQQHAQAVTLERAYEYSSADVFVQTPRSVGSSVGLNYAAQDANSPRHYPKEQQQQQHHHHHHHQQQQQPVIQIMPSGASSFTSAAPQPKSPNLLLSPRSNPVAPGTQFSINLTDYPSPSKPSASHYDAASAIAAHVLAAKHLHSSGSASNATVLDGKEFERCVRSQVC